MKTHIGDSVIGHYKSRYLMMRDIIYFLTFSLFACCEWAMAMDRLSIGTGADEHSFTQAELLTRPDVSDVVVPHDVAYGRTMTFRAMPLASLLDEAAMPTDTVLEAVAADGFAAQLPRELVLNRNPVKAVAMLAIEEPQKP